MDRRGDVIDVCQAGLSDALSPRHRHLGTCKLALPARPAGAISGAAAGHGQRQRPRPAAAVNTLCSWPKLAESVVRDDRPALTRASATEANPGACALPSAAR